MLGHDCPRLGASDRFKLHVPADTSTDPTGITLPQDTLVSDAIEATAVRFSHLVKTNFDKEDVSWDGLRTGESWNAKGNEG